MDKSSQFAWVFATTLTLTRIGVYLGVLFFTDGLNQPPPETEIFGLRIHHYAYGLILIFIGWLLKNTWLYAIGTALFVDELTFLLMGGQTHEDNYSTLSILGTIGLGIMVLVFRKPIVQLIKK